MSPRSMGWTNSANAASMQTTTNRTPSTVVVRACLELEVDELITARRGEDYDRVEERAVDGDSDRDAPSTRRKLRVSLFPPLDQECGAPQDKQAQQPDSEIGWECPRPNDQGSQHSADLAY